MITCRELVGFIAEYLDDALPATKHREFEAHLRACDRCVVYLDSYRRTIALGKAAFADLDAPVPPEVPDELVKAILDARRFRA
ncbi:MAG: zf-HC2 domain-containing protein [Planctomycetes bacterium]|nr:zf-HC2 domain-containing protein [Planctomycetota bacterium]MBI3843753.1 zf-HC2 domain-containing protein [Planctomycetota bacterium]